MNHSLGMHHHPNILCIVVLFHFYQLSKNHNLKQCKANKIPMNWVSHRQIRNHSQHNGSSPLLQLYSHCQYKQCTYFSYLLCINHNLQPYIDDKNLKNSVYFQRDRCIDLIPVTSRGLSILSINFIIQPSMKHSPQQSKENSILRNQAYVSLNHIHIFHQWTDCQDLYILHTYL